MATQTDDAEAVEPPHVISDIEELGGPKNFAKAEAGIEEEISSEAQRHIQRLKVIREQQQKAAQLKARQDAQQKIRDEQDALVERGRIRNEQLYPHVDQSHILDISKRSYPRPPNRTPLGLAQPHNPRIQYMMEYFRPHLVFHVMPFLHDWDRQNWLHAAMMGPLFVPNTPPPGHPNYDHKRHAHGNQHTSTWALSPHQQQMQRQKHRQQMQANAANGQKQVNLNQQQVQVFRQLKTPQQRQNYLKQIYQQRLKMQEVQKRAREAVKKGVIPAANGRVLNMYNGGENVDDSTPQTVRDHIIAMQKEKQEQEEKEKEANKDGEEDDEKKEGEEDDGDEKKEGEEDEKKEGDETEEFVPDADAEQEVANAEKEEEAQVAAKEEEAKKPEEAVVKPTEQQPLLTAPSPDILPDYQMSNMTSMTRPMSTQLFDKVQAKDGSEPADETKPDSEEKPSLADANVAPPELIFPQRPRIQLNSQLGIVDPHTLLERLNSRRLYLRVNSKEHPNLTYVKNKQTAIMASEEWEEILQCSRDNRPFVNPPKYEMMLFSPINQPVAILASYPRSGNSLMRTLYERTTVRVTGSDMRGGLTKHDLVGEAAVGNGMVQFVKTHFPERRGTPPFKASNVILLVRNPYDAIDSYFNLMMTNTHTTSVSEEVREKNKAAFEEMALKEIQVWKDFHEYWLAQEIPTLLVRYEDLTRHTDKVMSRVLEHALEVRHMHFFNRRITHCIEKEKIEKLGSYKPRSGGIGKALKKYSPELLQKLNVGIVDTMQKLGYGSLLVPNVDEWDLTPLPGYATKLTRPKGTVIVNQGDLVRTKERQTNWGQVRQKMGLAPEQVGMCQCWKCKEKGLN